MQSTIIETEHLSKVHAEDTRALDAVTLSIESGEWVSITGPSGSGKTTLLNMIGCLDSPTAGSIRVNGSDVTRLNQVQLTRFRRDNIGLIFQQYHLVPYLTALENVMLAQYYHSITDEAEARETLKRVGLSHRETHLPAQLSGGEQQRVCIARALVNEPQILLADEPTGNLDRSNGQNILNLIKNLHEDGHTIVLVTHNPDVAELGDRTINLIDGKLENATEREIESEANT